MSKKIKEFILPIEEINEIAKYLKEEILNKNIVVLLQGDLASGKTTLVKKTLESFGLKMNVDSPTFSIQNIYEGNFFHYDIYNKTLEEFISLGMLEEFEKNGIHFVEWGDDNLEKILKDYGFKTLKIVIENFKNKRRYCIYA